MNSAFASSHTLPDLDVINSGPMPSTDIFSLPEGYTIEPVLWNLSLSTSTAFDDQGNMYVAEGGTGEGFTDMPRILKVDPSDNVSVLAYRGFNAPINDIEFHNGTLYASHRGIISTVNLTNGMVKDIIVGLPSVGDHHNDQIAFGPDGRLYFGQGTATNSGVVGEDNFALGWLKLAKKFHDIPGKDITLTGQNFVSGNPLTPADMTDNATTGAFVPFGNTTVPGQVIKGDVKCTGCVISAMPDGSDLQLVGWGFRNPFATTFSEDGRLLVVQNGADERGSRPIANDTDNIYLVDVSDPENMGKFYGWPDFFRDAMPVTDPSFQSPRGNGSALQPLIMNPPPVEEPIAHTELGYSPTQAEFSTSSEFGHEGMAFINILGTFAPITHTVVVDEPKISILDPETGNLMDFLLVDLGDISFRPVGIEFNEEENAMYVTTVGALEIRETTPEGTPLPMPAIWVYPNSGIVWKIVKSDTTAAGADTMMEEQPMMNDNQTEAMPATNTTSSILEGSEMQDDDMTGSNQTENGSHGSNMG